MRIIQLTPGTGNFHCGNCLRDAALVSALRRMGHDVLMVPLYLPHVTDGTDLSDTPVFFGGVNVYLQQKSALFRHTPRWFDHLLDRPGLLRWAADHSGMTSGRQLGQITVSMLRGEEGLQNKELTRLTGFLRSGPPVDVVCLSNALLIGLARRIRDETGAAIACTMAGEDTFLDWLEEPYRGEAWSLMRQRAVDVDAFIPVSRYYADEMSHRLGLPGNRLHVIHNGIDTSAFSTAQRPPVPTIGYMAYLSKDKGLGLLIDSFIELRRGPVPDARLHIAGAVTPTNRGYADEQRERLDRAGLRGHYEILSNVDAEQKRRFLSSLSVLSVPATYGEAFGLYVLEAWASGVPVVQPHHGAFPEILERGRGGVLCRPGDAASLAQAIAGILRSPDRGEAMGDEGRRAVREYFNVERMALEVARVYEGISPR